MTGASWAKVDCVCHSVAADRGLRNVLGPAAADSRPARSRRSGGETAAILRDFWNPHIRRTQASAVEHEVAGSR